MAVHAVSASEVGVYELTLIANTEEVIQFATDIGTIEILNMDGAASVYFSTTDHATVGGKRCRVLPAALTAVLYDPTGSDPTTVSVISAGTPTISVGRA